MGTVSRHRAYRADIIDTLSVPNGGIWTKFTVYSDSSTGYNMSDDHIMIVSSDTSTYNAVYIEDILIKDASMFAAIGHRSRYSGHGLAQITYSASGIATWLEYGPSGFTQGTGTQVQVTGSPAWLTGLTSNTTYDVYVVQMCSDSTISPGYGPVSFKTLACSLSQMCTFDIELTDTYGDGWNGAEVEVLNSNGSVEYTLGANFITGISYTETISLCTGGSFTIVVSDEGGYPGEIGLNVISGGSTIDSYSATSATTVGTQMASFSSNCNVLCPAPSNLTYNAGERCLLHLQPERWEWNRVYQGPTGFLQATGTGFTLGLTPPPRITSPSQVCLQVLLRGSLSNTVAQMVSDTLGPAFCTGMCDNRFRFHHEHVRYLW